MSITTICQVLEVAKARRDGAALFGEHPFEDWGGQGRTEGKKSGPVSEVLHLSRSKSVSLAVNVMTIQTESELLLVDTGTPATHDLVQTIDKTDERWPLDPVEYEWSRSKLQSQLKTADASVKKISKVILTSFDLDHAGGLTRLDRTGRTVYSFEHAEIFYHANTQQRERPRTVPNADLAAEMIVQNQHHPCWEATEIIPGVILHPIVGPSLQGCIVEVCRGADRFLYLGDLCPTVYHVNPAVVPAFDDNPDATYRERNYWIGLAKSKGYKIIFGHGAHIKAAWIQDTKGGLAIKPA